MGHVMLAAALVVLAPCAAGAQDNDCLSVGSYAYLRNGGTNFVGWEADVAWEETGGPRGAPGLSLEVSASRMTSAETAPPGVPSPAHRRTTVMAGFRGGVHSRIPAFLRLGMGYSRRSFLQPEGGGAVGRSGRSSLALAAGLGLQFVVGDRVVLRPVQVEHMLFPNDSGARNGLQISTGIGIRW